MKRSILFLAYAFILALTSRAQSGANNAPTAPPHPPQPTQQAIHQLEALQVALDDLSPEQVITLNSILLDRNISLDSLKDHPSGDPKADNQLRNSIWHNSDVRIYAVLWDKQQVKYVLWKQQQRIDNLEKQVQALKAATAAPDSSQNHSSTPR
ncbi:MAG TPA: hypothetical protein VGS79_23790 [Puia sp.]|nr:hypothetical protein [Puia sp.]